MAGVLTLLLAVIESRTLLVGSVCAHAAWLASTGYPRCCAYILASFSLFFAGCMRRSVDCAMLQLQTYPLRGYFVQAVSWFFLLDPFRFFRAPPGRICAVCLWWWLLFHRCPATKKGGSTGLLRHCAMTKISLKWVCLAWS